MIVYSTIVKCTFILFLQSLQCVRTDQSAAPNITEDATVLFNLLTIMGMPDKERIVSLLANRTNAQRQEIKAAYKSLFKVSLDADIETRFSGDLQEAALSLMIPANEFYARKLNQAMVGIGTDETAVNEILTSVNRTEIVQIAATYENLFKRTLKADLISDTSSYYQDLVVELSKGVRSNDTDVDPNTALLDAFHMKYALENQSKIIKETMFITILTTRSFAQLKIIFEEFEKIMEKPIIYAIWEAIKDNALYNGLTNIVKVSYNKIVFFAESLYYSMRGFGTDDYQLIRIIVGRSEIDLPKIRDAYYLMYNTTLVESIVDDTSGAYTTLLCLLVQKN